jgi:hypothetical protein
MQNKYDLAVCYRIYPGVSKVPPIFPDDKLKLSELCFASLVESLGDLKVKLFVLLDKCPEIYKQIFLKYFPKDDIEFIELNAVGNNGTFKLQMEILSEQNDSEFVYFAEDDYFYLKDGLKNLLGFMKSGKDINFATPYYHPEIDKMKVHLDFKSEKRFYEKNEFVSSASTTMTFLTTKSVLRQTYDVLMTYTRRNDDASLWFSLTKHKTNNPFLILKYFFTDKLWFKMYAKIWYFTKKQIILGKKWKLWVPLSTFATHMDDKCLAPKINWQMEFAKSLEKINFVS